jgi:hypothetical protein
MSSMGVSTGERPAPDGDEDDDAAAGDGSICFRVFGAGGEEAGGVSTAMSSMGVSTGERPAPDGDPDDDAAAGGGSICFCFLLLGTLPARSSRFITLVSRCLK